MSGFLMASATAVFALLAPLHPLMAHDIITTKITWSREVSRIVSRHCVRCHGEDGPAFPLLTYEQARPWAKAIRDEVLSRRMPPWNAVKGFGEFKNDRSLTQEDLEIVADWVEGGAPEGDPLLLPSMAGGAAAMAGSAPPMAGSAPAKAGIAAEDPKSAGTRRLALSGSVALKQPIAAVAIEPVEVPPEGVLQIIARRPDGALEPLIWIRNFNPGYRESYYFRKELNLPAGAEIEVTPPGGKAILLVRPGGSLTSIPKRKH